MCVLLLIGFSTFNDITYPLVTQTVITNGRLWSFYGYQLNTTLLHSENAKENPQRNLCYGTKPLPLYDGVESGRVVGFNPDVLKSLLKLYLNVPKHREGVELKPYLDPSVRHIAEMKHIPPRVWWEKQFKHMYSNRPRHRLMYEIYPWERIYKINHKTRPLDKRLRPFELPDNNPFKRCYNDHTPEYMPKILRPAGKRTGFSRQKFFKTYYNK
uniref:(California timema) hypothetical protein n=1 Tax=Timema californicum TaxID=61474 RepID=A0A7R9P4F4_TIMCA|nr:unnamed protein product [Timema californicum]